MVCRGEVVFGGVVIKDQQRRRILADGVDFGATELICEEKSSMVLISLYPLVIRKNLLCGGLFDD